MDATNYLLYSEANKKYLQGSYHFLAEGKGITFAVEKLEKKFSN